jgi:hypothetical protein
MPGPKARFAIPALLVALTAAVPLAGCETTGDPLAAVTTAPGQYDYYDCPAIKVAAAGLTGRQRELEALMARANQGPAGGLISATTYQPEYITLRGKMSELRRVAAENHCNFVPGAAPAAQLPPPAKKPAKRVKRG